MMTPQLFMSKAQQKLADVFIVRPAERKKTTYFAVYGGYKTHPSKPEDFDFTGQQGADFIYDTLNSERPAMISRFGSVELDAITMCLALRTTSFRERYRNYIHDTFDDLLFNENFIRSLRNNAGFFDADRKSLEAFTDIYLESMRNIDILGLWHYKEKYVRPYLNKDIKTIPLWYLEPYFYDKPAWSRVLKGKNVLVVHPFVETIKKQGS